MHGPSLADATRLARDEHDWTLSIYMPLERAGTPTRANLLRLKNQISAARRRLEARGLPTPKIGQALEPLQDYTNSTRGLPPAAGMALFAAPDMFEMHALPVAPEELTVVAPRFMVTPLLAALEHDAEFFVLAFSQHDVRLLHATQRDSADVTPEQMPRDIREVRAPSEPPDDLQLHTLHIGAAGSSAIFHGHGGEPDRVEPERRYLRAINEELARHLRGQRAPLVFAGDVQHLNLFREINTYPHLCAEVIRGAPDKSTDKQLREQAATIVGHERERQRQRRVEGIRAAVAAGAGEANLQRVLSAAEEGRVGELLISAGHHAWSNGDVQSVHAYPGDNAAPRQPSDAEDLANLAAVLTLRYGGQIVVAARGEADPQMPVAAVLRDRAGLAL